MSFWRNFWAPLLCMLCNLQQKTIYSESFLGRSNFEKVESDSGSGSLNLQKFESGSLVWVLKFEKIWVRVSWVRVLGPGPQIWENLSPRYWVPFQVPRSGSSNLTKFELSLGAKSGSLNLRKFESGSFGLGPGFGSGSSNFRKFESWSLVLVLSPGPQIWENLSRGPGSGSWVQVLKFEKIWVLGPGSGSSVRVILEISVLNAERVRNTWYNNPTSKRMNLFWKEGDTICVSNNLSSGEIEIYNK